MNLATRLAKLEHQAAPANERRRTLFLDGCDPPHWFDGGAGCPRPVEMHHGPPDVRESDLVFRYTGNMCHLDF